MVDGAAAGIVDPGIEVATRFRPLPKRGGIVTNELIDKLREEDAY